MADELNRQQLKKLVELAFAACLGGEVPAAREMFKALRVYDPALKSAVIGEALTHIVVDDFSAGDDMLEVLESDDDVKSVQVLSLCLQKRRDEALALFDKIKDKSGAVGAMAQAVIEATSA